MFIAEEKRFDAAQAGMANLRRSRVLITSSVDCCRAGYMWAAWLGLLGSPRRCRTALVSRPVGAS